MAETSVQVVCGRCGGDGIDESGPSSVACITCDETGYIDRFELHHPVNVFESYIVLEQLDATEHAGLTDTQKDGVLHLLACGKVDLNDGKAGRVRLWNWFGAESTTVANLTALLS